MSAELTTCLEGIEEFCKKGPFTAEAVLELAESVIKVSYNNYKAHEKFKAAIVDNYNEFLNKDLEALYKLSETNSAILDALQLVNLSQLKVPLEDMDEESFGIYSIHAGREIVNGFIMEKTLTQTSEQRQRVLTALRINSMERHKKSKV